MNYFLLYPLAAVELGAIKEAPENNENLLRRCVAAFVYSKAKENEKSIFIKKFNTPGFKKYLKAYESELIPLYQNFRFSRKINDINPFFLEKDCMDFFNITILKSAFSAG